MTTLVGIQNNFADAIKELIELDYDAIEAYKTAINRILMKITRSSWMHLKWTMKDM
ncbi:hypothetical protein RHORCCE3_0998 [Rickettsia hoogstraalii str. RCCE3]|nr:hypothetical protein RHORCCE3_0998 [Rickettsia hoogstraalii str. RCCE3]